MIKSGEERMGGGRGKKTRPPPAPTTSSAWLTSSVYENGNETIVNYFVPLWTGWAGINNVKILSYFLFISLYQIPFLDIYTYIGFGFYEMLFYVFFCHGFPFLVHPG